MPVFARHFPTQRFTLAEFSAMPVGKDDGSFPPDGFVRWSDHRGKCIVGYSPPYDGTPDWMIGGTYVVRPIVRVPAVTERAI